MKDHLNVHHSNSRPYMAIGSANHRGRQWSLENKDRAASGRRNPAQASPYEVEQNMAPAPSSGEPLGCNLGGNPMFTAEEFRVKAAEYAESLRHTDDPNEIRDLNRLKESFTRLAQNEDWLAHNFDKMIQSHDVAPQPEAAAVPVDRRTVAAIEEHVLRCLGAAVVMQWNSIPTKLQRELFDTAGSLGNVLNTTALRGQIARFLHKQEGGKSPANVVSEAISREDRS
jgi:hypothetical protein